MFSGHRDVVQGGRLGDQSSHGSRRMVVIVELGKVYTTIGADDGVH